MSAIGLWVPGVRFSSLFITQGDGCLLGQICPSLTRDTKREERMKVRRKEMAGRS